MTEYSRVRAIAPQFVERVERAVDTHDVDALGMLDGEVRGLVATLLATQAHDPAAVLTELSELYRRLLVRCEARRDTLKQTIGAQQRAHVGIAAYRSSGAVSRNA